MTSNLTIWMPVDKDGAWKWVGETSSGVAVSHEEKSELELKNAKEINVIIPGQWAKTFSHDLPKMQAKERLSAAAFSIEDQTASALKEQHIVLGSRGDDRIAVIASDKITQTLTILSDAGLSPDGLYIDFDVLSDTVEPVRLSDRIIIPGPDGHTLDPDWDDGEFADLNITAPAALSNLINIERAINLRQGEHRRRGDYKLAGSGLGRIAALFVALGLSWGLYEGVQARALNQQAAAYKTEANSLYTQATGKPAPANVALAVTRAAKNQPTSGVDVLKLSNQLFTAIAQTEGVMIDVLQYDHDKQELVLRLIYPQFESASELERAAAAIGGEFQAGGVREQGGELIGDAVFRLGGAS